jgi:hypothetical protein
MSLSLAPAYIAEHGIVAENGPKAGKVLDDGHLLFRTITAEGGYYKLRGKADGSLVYIFEPRFEHDPPDMAA